MHVIGKISFWKSISQLRCVILLNRNISQFSEWDKQKKNVFFFLARPPSFMLKLSYAGSIRLWVGIRRRRRNLCISLLTQTSAHSLRWIHIYACAVRKKKVYIKVFVISFVRIFCNNKKKIKLFPPYYFVTIAIPYNALCFLSTLLLLAICANEHQELFRLILSRLVRFFFSGSSFELTKKCYSFRNFIFFSKKIISMIISVIS